MTILKCATIFLLITITACQVQQSNSPASQDKRAATADTHQNSLNWSGVYRGTLPCADCGGIQTEITLNQDQSYLFVSKYLGKGNESTKVHGSFQWDETGDKITLQNLDVPNRYVVEENVLIKLDMNDKRISGDLSENYKLQKVSENNIITERTWRLVVLKEKAITPNQNQKAPYFILNSVGGTITGYSGCNSFNGTYTIEGNRIKFSKMISTMMACMDIPYEHEFLGIFETTDNYIIKGDTLTMNKGKMAPLARFVYMP